MHLTPREKDKLLIAMAAMVARAPAGARRQAEPSGGDRADHRFRRRGRPRRPQRRRPDGGRRPCRRPRPGHGGHRRDDPRRPGGGDLSRRHQARHRPSTRSAEEAHMIPGEIIAAAGEIELNAGAPRRHARGRQHRRPADPGRLALSFLRDQRRAAASTARRRAACASTFPPAPPCASSRARRREVTLVPYRGARTVFGFQQKIMGTL